MRCMYVTIRQFALANAVVATFQGELGPHRGDSENARQSVFKGPQEKMNARLVLTRNPGKMYLC
jgi:hypothetical protein